MANKFIEALKSEVPREDAKKIAMVTTAIIVLLMSFIGYKLFTAKDRVLGDWESGASYDSGYADPGYYYIYFYPDGKCSVGFDIKNSVLGWGTGGKWSVDSINITGINITVRTDWEEVLPNQTVYHYNPFTDRITRDSLVYKRME